MDVAPLDDDWNERRRIQMTSLVGGIKGEQQSVCVCVCVCNPGSAVYDLIRWRVTNVNE